MRCTLLAVFSTCRRRSRRFSMPAAIDSGAAALLAAPDLQILKAARDRSRVVKRNAGASLVDLDDGVLAVEFHSKLNTIGGETVQMLHAGVKEATGDFAALVVGNDAPNFSAGANLMLLLLEAQEGNWDEIEVMVRAFQEATDGAALCGCAGHHGDGGPDYRRRLRDRASWRSHPGSGGKLHRPRRTGRRPDSGGGGPRKCSHQRQRVPHAIADLLPFGFQAPRVAGDNHRPAVDALSSAFRVITFSLAMNRAPSSRSIRAVASGATSIRCAPRSISAGSIGRSCAVSRSVA